METDNVIGVRRSFVGILRSARLPARPTARAPARPAWEVRQGLAAELAHEETEASALRRYFTARVRAKSRRRTVSDFVRLNEIGFSVSWVKPVDCSRRTSTFPL